MENPVETPLKRAGAQLDGYAYETGDGTLDSDTIENQLERLEKPAGPIFRKIKNREVLTAEEKLAFSAYITLMYRRVLPRREAARQAWPALVESSRAESGDLGEVE